MPTIIPENEEYLEQIGFGNLDGAFLPCFKGGVGGILAADATTGKFRYATASDDFGITGIRGPQGVTGFNGVNGTDATGVTGLQGIQGVTGLNGLDTTGATGLEGIQGVTGFDGLQGVTGLEGIQGVTGLNGLDATGATGIQGIQGYTGLAGTDGGWSGTNGHLLMYTNGDMAIYGNSPVIYDGTAIKGGYGNAAGSTGIYTGIPSSAFVRQDKGTLTDEGHLTLVGGESGSNYYTGHGFIWGTTADPTIKTTHATFVFNNNYVTLANTSGPVANTDSTYNLCLIGTEAADGTSSQLELINRLGSTQTVGYQVNYWSYTYGS
jgi:hypothetical protein